MGKRTRLLVPVVLAGQAVLVHWAAARERLPPLPQLSGFPAVVGDWRMLHEDPLEPDVVNTLRADELLSRTYLRTTREPVAGMFVAWFQSQRAGAGQPHSPQVCLPAAGWTPQETSVIGMDTTAGVIQVNRYVVANQSDRAVVLYWYQSPRRVTAGEWAAKLGVVFDAFRDRRSDTALVRIVVGSTYVGDAIATTTAIAFAKTLYPALRQRLP